MLVAVGNGPSYGGGMRVTARTPSFDDGLLDVLVLHKISIAGVPAGLPAVFKGTHVAHPAVQVLRARTVRLEADRHRRRTPTASASDRCR